MKAWEILSSKEKWTQAAWGRDANGAEVNSSDLENAVCFCLGGAIIKAYGLGINGMRDEYADKLLAKLTPHLDWGDYSYIFNWNDSPSRTYEEVVALLKELDI